MPVPPIQTPPHYAAFLSNVEEVRRLLKIHEQLSGTSPGRRSLEVLNKSAIVLLVACWEAYIEDLARNAFKCLVQASAVGPSAFPTSVLVLASKPLVEAPDQRLVWQLAGDGWRRVMSEHADEILDRYVGKLNTPRASQVDAIFAKMLGFPGLSVQWHWGNVEATAAVQRLDDLVTLRGEIAHRLTPVRSVRKKQATAAIVFLTRLAVISSNRVRQHVSQQTSTVPWIEVRYRSTR